MSDTNVSISVRLEGSSQRYPYIFKFSLICKKCNGGSWKLWPKLKVSVIFFTTVHVWFGSSASLHLKSLTCFNFLSFLYFDLSIYFDQSIYFDLRLVWTCQVPFPPCHLILPDWRVHLISRMRPLSGIQAVTGPVLSMTKYLLWKFYRPILLNFPGGLNSEGILVLPRAEVGALKLVMKKILCGHSLPTTDSSKAVVSYLWKNGTAKGACLGIVWIG